MTLSVSSDFKAAIEGGNPTLIRRFFVGSTDYSDRVVKWGRVSQSWDEAKPQSFGVDLANEDQILNTIQVDKTLLNVRCAAEFGVQYAVGSEETYTVIAGTMRSVSYKKGICSIKIEDKMKQLTQRVVGTREDAVDFTTSNHLVSDLAWYLCTSYGGLDATKSSANPDIDYDQFSEWAGVMSGDSVVVQALFEGNKVLECLRKIARMTSTGLYLENDKVVFSRFTVSSPPLFEINATNMQDPSLRIDATNLINKQYVNAGYDTTSDYFTISVVDASTMSVNSYGLNEQTEEDSTIWHVTSEAALNLAQRLTYIRDDPIDDISLTMPAEGVLHQVGDNICYINSHMSIDETYRVMSRSFDMDSGKVSLGINRSQVVNSFILDVTSLDGTEVLT